MFKYSVANCLDHGVLAEFDTPYRLLQKEKGIFRGMCEKTGEFDALLSIAKRKAESVS